MRAGETSRVDLKFNRLPRARRSRSLESLRPERQTVLTRHNWVRVPADLFHYGKGLKILAISYRRSVHVSLTSSFLPCVIRSSDLELYGAMTSQWHRMRFIRRRKSQRCIEISINRDSKQLRIVRFAVPLFSLLKYA